MVFADRRDAGQRLAVELLRFKNQAPVVLALPRGGVPVGFEIATRLEAPLDVVLVRKIGHPLSPELAVGAVADGDRPERFIDESAVAGLDVPRAYLDAEINRQLHEIEHRHDLYFKDRQPVDIREHTAIVVDDGIATGATMRAALRATRRRSPATLVLAVPVAPASVLAALRSEVDEIVCLSSQEDFGAVGLFYADFGQVEDDVVIDLLDRAAARVRPPHPTSPRTAD
ncbi:MAG TPA: phosphoribosyltransferase family protein [Stellaceae bacterium]|nr:phosphoribosyltransferase family protein [Stellaceae bacterium]